MSTEFGSPALRADSLQGRGPSLKAPAPHEHALDPEAFLNIDARLVAAAARWPFARAVVTPRGVHQGEPLFSELTFRELDQKVETYARGLAALGLSPGARTLLMVRPSAELFALTFALFRLGAVPVLIDPAMGKDAVLGAIREVEPEAMIAIARGQVARLVYPDAFRSVRLSVSVGSRWGFGGFTLSEVEARGKQATEPCAAKTRAQELAAILFTSGSTGAPKGVLYTHGIFDAQVELFERDFGIRPGEVELSSFPLFSLFSLALGVTVIIPEMDAARPAAVEPTKIVQAILHHGVTYAFGSPAFWRPIARHCAAHGVVLESLTRILMAGAPAPVPLLESLLTIIPPEADVFTPYGATECLPVTFPSARALLAGPARLTAEGRGTCVGRPMSSSRLAIIAIDDGPIPTLGEATFLAPGQRGEIAVESPVTTRGYFRRPADDARAKMAEGERTWHRMGDVGYLDDEGRLWFLGRKSQRVEFADGTILFTEPVEAVFDQHPRVFRTALVGLGERPRQEAALVVECHREARPKGRSDEARLVGELLQLGARHAESSRVKVIVFHESFPVDARHNAKIRREVLATWAAEQLRRRGPPG